MNREEMAAAFNEWMRRYTVDPQAFEAEFETVGIFLAQKRGGETPTYGDKCASLMLKIHEDLKA